MQKVSEKAVIYFKYEPPGFPKQWPLLADTKTHHQQQKQEIP